MKDIFDPKKRVIMVIGSSDSGKTTLVWSLARSLRGYFATAIVDLDMGQSRIGPPTTVGWAMMEPDVEDWSGLNVRDFYFTGTVTPLGSLLPAVTGAGLVARMASNSAEKVIIDTTGLISEPAGRVLKHYKIDIIRPDIIIAIESSDELSHIIGPLEFNKRPKIIRIPEVPGVRVKTPVGRAEHRFKGMMDYLKNARTVSLKTDEVGIRFTRSPLSKSDFINMVVSMRDENNRDIAIGVIKAVRETELKILTPLNDTRKVSSIIIGRTFLDTKNRTLKDS